MSLFNKVLLNTGGTLSLTNSVEDFGLGYPLGRKRLLIPVNFDGDLAIYVGVLDDRPDGSYPGDFFGRKPSGSYALIDPFGGEISGEIAKGVHFGTDRFVDIINLDWKAREVRVVENEGRGLRRGHQAGHDRRAADRRRHRRLRRRSAAGDPRRARGTTRRDVPAGRGGKMGRCQRQFDHRLREDDACDRARRCLRNYNRRIIANVKFMPGTPIWNDLVRFGPASIGVPADFMRRGFTAPIKTVPRHRWVPVLEGETKPKTQLLYNVRLSPPNLFFQKQISDSARQGSTAKTAGVQIASRGQDITVAPAIGLSERVSKQPLDMSHSPCQFCHR